MRTTTMTTIEFSDIHPFHVRERDSPHEAAEFSQPTHDSEGRRLAFSSSQMIIIGFLRKFQGFIVAIIVDAEGT